MNAITIVRLPNPGNERCPLELLHTIVARVDLAQSEALHAPSKPQPFATWRRSETVDVVSFDDDLTQALLRGEPLARLVTRRCVNDLLAPMPGDRVMRLAIETPAHFRVRGLDHTVPDPFHLFGGLLERWRALDYPEIDPPDLRILPVVIDRYLVRRHPTAGGRPQRGFLGLLWLDLLPLSDADRQSLWTLARFGEFRGIGAHTSYGMGRMRLLARGERWEPDRPRGIWEVRHAA